MPTPVQISASARVQQGVYQPGPYVYGGNLYVVLADPVNYHAEVWKSTDDGATWAEVDSGNHKMFAINGSAQSPVSACLGYTSNLIQIAYIPDGDTQVAIAPFNMATDAWGAVVTGGPTQNLPSSGYWLMMPCQFSNGDLGLVYTVDTSTYSHIQYARYSGAWGAAIDIMEPGVTETDAANYHPYAAAVDSEDRLHIRAVVASAYFRNRNVTSSTVHALQVLSSIDQPNITNVYAGPAITFDHCGSEWIANPAILRLVDSVSSSTARPAAMLNTVENEPQSVRVDIVTDEILTTDSGAFQTGNFQASIVYLDGALYLYYPWADESGGQVNGRVRVSCSKLGNWSAPSDVFASALGDAGVIEYVCARAISDTEIGVIIQGGQVGSGTYAYPHYFAVTPSCSQTSLCSGGEGALYVIT